MPVVTAGVTEKRVVTSGNLAGLVTTGGTVARHLLTDTEVKQTKPEAKPYRMADGDALYLFVTRTGVKSWQFRYRLDGKPQTATLGKYPVVSLAEARAKAEQARKAITDGVEKRVAKARKVADIKSTFESVAHRWVRPRARRKGWSDEYKAEVEASLANHLEPLMRLLIGEIDARLVAPVLEKVEDTAPFMVEKVRPRLHSILDHAVRLGLIRGNPLPLSKDEARLERRHFPAIRDLPAIGEILRQARATDPCKGVTRAHLLLAFTAQRVSEVTGATWDEFDLGAGLWTIPRARMKQHKDPDRGAHVIPLPARLLALVREWREADGGSSVFVCVAPRDTSRPVKLEAIEKFYRRQLNLAGKHSPHSWRAAFSSIARDHGKDGDVIEAQLDHIIGTRVQAAYDRAQRVELRRELMTWYEDQLIAARDGAQVLPIHRAT